MAEGEQFALAGFKAALRGQFGRERFMADDGGEHGVVNGQFVAKQRLLEQLGVEIVFDFDEERFAQDFAEGFVGAGVKDLVVAVGAGELVVFDQPVRFQHPAEDEAIEELLAGEGDFLQRTLWIAQGKAVGDEQPPAFEVGEKLLVQAGFVCSS